MCSEKINLFFVINSSLLCKSSSCDETVRLKYNDFLKTNVKDDDHLFKYIYIYVYIAHRH